MLAPSALTGPLIFVASLLHLSSYFTPERSSQIRELTWSDVNFLHTTDTHGWYAGHHNQKNYNGDWGDFISFTQRMRGIAAENMQDLILVDSGDRHDGNGFSDITVPNGLVSMQYFALEDYDLVTLGNHELYLWNALAMELQYVKPHFGDRYVVSNVEYKENETFVPFANRFRYFITPHKGYRVLALSFIFDFQRANANVRVIPLRQVIDTADWFKAMIKEYDSDTVDILIINGHIPISHLWGELEYLHQELRNHYPYQVIQYFGGHSHIRDYTVMDSKSTGLQSGKYCETIGWISASMTTKSQSVFKRFSRSYIDFNRNSFSHHSHLPTSLFDTELGLSVSKRMATVRNSLGLEKVIGNVSKSYYIDFVPLDHPQNIYRFLTESVLLTLPFKSVVKNERIILINSGSIRYDLYKGVYTLDSQYIVSPFENKWVLTSLPINVATRVAQKLNDGVNIMSKAAIAQYWHKRDIGSNRPKVSCKGLRKGYVTHDAFGNLGDDTPHCPYAHYDIPNIVELRQLYNVTSGSDRYVDLVFSDFLIPYVVQALKALGLALDKDPEHYSSIFLGELLTEYIRTH